MLKLHDWIHIELWVHLPRLPDILTSLIWLWPTGNIAMRAWHTKSSHTLALNPLCAHAASFVAKAKHLIR